MAEYIYPTTTRAVSDNFAAHINRGSVNPGTDYMTSRGTRIVAVAAGRVVIADSNPGGSGGRIISIKHNDGSITDYLHLQSLSVTVNQTVTQGQQIGLTGASANGGESGVGPHLHISLHRGAGAASLTRGGSVDFERYVGGGAPSGSDGNIALAQQLLNNLGYGLVVDGINGPKTTAAVKDFQTKHGLVVDGIPGPITMGALQSAQPKPPTRPVAGRNNVGIQKMLKANYGYQGALDNNFGPQSISAHQRFVKANWGYTGPVDGVMSTGGATWKASQRWLAAKYGYTGAIDGIPGDGTNAAWNRADAANNAAF